MEAILSKPKGIAREAQRRALTGIPTSTWYEMQAASLAPKPIKLGVRSVGWLISELEEWIAQRRAERDAEWQPLGDAAARVVSKLGAKST